MTASPMTLALVATAAAGGGLLLIPEPNDVERVSLTFPPDLTSDQVETVLGLAAGLPARSRVIAEVESQGGNLRFTLEANPNDVAALRAGLQGFATGVRLQELDDQEALPPPRLHAYLSWRGMYVLLKSDQRDLAAAALLGVLRSTSRGERLRLRLRLRPIVRPNAPPYRQQGHEPRGLARMLMPRQPLPADQVHRIRQQYAGPLLSVRIELFVWTATRRRARNLLSRVVAVYRARSGVRGRFSVRTHRFALPGFGTMLAPPELVPLLAWPVQGPDVPGLTYVRSPQRLPDAAIPTRGGRRWGVSTWPGMESRELHQPAVGALSHALILGPTGSGKSSLLTGLMLDDLAAGRGVLLLDMKGDTAVDVLERIPDSRRGDVVVLDPADARPVPGIKGMGSGAPELTADLWVGLFKNLFADSWGIRTERYLRLGIQTLTLATRAVITDLPRVLTDASFRRSLLMRASEPWLRQAWASFEALSPSQQAEHLQAPLGKVQDLVGRRVVRAVLGQLEPKMTIRRAMREQRILVARLSPASLGGPTAQLLGALIMFEIYQAVLGRQRLTPGARTPFMVYVDEPAVMGLSNVPLDSLYELARGLGVGITTATQSAFQLPMAVQRAVLTNGATMASFRADADDAALIARRLPGVTAEQLQHLGQYEIALRLGLAPGKVSSVATARTLPLSPPCSDPEVLRERSAERYGISAEEIDQQVQERLDHPVLELADSVPLGRRRLG